MNEQIKPYSKGGILNFGAVNGVTTVPYADPGTVIDDIGVVIEREDAAYQSLLADSLAPKMAPCAVFGVGNTVTMELATGNTNQYLLIKASGVTVAAAGSAFNGQIIHDFKNGIKLVKLFNGMVPGTTTRSASVAKD